MSTISKQRGGGRWLGRHGPPLRAAGVVIVLHYCLSTAGRLLLGRLRLAKVGGQIGGAASAVCGAQKRNLVLAAHLLHSVGAVAAGVARIVNRACCQLGAAACLDVSQGCQGAAVIRQQQAPPRGQRPGSSGGAAVKGTGREGQDCEDWDAGREAAAGGT